MPARVQAGKKQLLAGSEDVFGASEKSRKHYESEIKELHANRSVDYGTGFFSQSVRTLGMAERKTEIEKDNSISVVKKCNLLDMNRSTYYYQPVEQLLEKEELPACRTGREIKKQMDKLHMKYPFMGSRSLRDQLKLKGYVVNRKRVQRLMK